MLGQHAQTLYNLEAAIQEGSLKYMFLRSSQNFPKDYFTSKYLSNILFIDY